MLINASCTHLQRWDMCCYELLLKYISEIYALITIDIWTCVQKYFVYIYKYISETYLSPISNINFVQGFWGLKLASHPIPQRSKPANGSTNGNGSNLRPARNRSEWHLKGEGIAASQMDFPQIFWWKICRTKTWVLRPEMFFVDFSPSFRFVQTFRRNCWTNDFGSVIKLGTHFDILVKLVTWRH